MYSDFEILKAFLLILRRSGFGKNGLPYNIPVRGQLTPINSCFDVLRKFLPEEFKDKSNKEILKYLRKDPRSAERLVATRFRLEEAQELMQALEEEPVVTAEASGQPTPTGQEVPPVGTTGAPIGNLPSAPSISTPQIPIRMPKAPVPEPEISKLYVTDAGGNVVEERSIKPTSVSAHPAAQGPSQFHVTDERGNIVQTYSKEPTPVAPQTEAPQQPKLVIADRYGNIKEPQKPPGPQTLYTQDSSGIIREHQVKPPSRFSVLRSRLSSFGSPLMNKIAGSAGPAIKKGLGGIGRGITGIGRDGLQAAAPALGRTFNKSLDGLDRLTNPRRPNFRRKPKLASKLTTGRKVALALALFFIVFMGILVMPPGGTVPTGQAAPISNPISNPVNNLSNCVFTREGKPNPVKSSALASFFTEVAAKTGVPAAALASVAMHESQVFTSGADNNHDAFGNSNITTATGCAHFGLSSIGSSSTGALGLMQVQPPKRIHDLIAASSKIPSFENVGAYSTGGVEMGAGFIGKTVDSLTLQDFCDVKTSIYLGAGVLISKNGGKPPTTEDEVNKSVCGYYGSCIYNGYNYGNEAQVDFANCKPTGGTAPAPPGPIGISLTCPIDNITVTCGTAANPVNNCGHGGIGYTTKCDPTYYACVGDKYSDALYYAIDVRGNINNKVALPFINGNESVEWTRIKDDPIPIGGGTWGYRVDYKAKDKNGRELILDLTHLNNQAPPLTVIKSGTPTGGNLIPGLVDLNYLINPAKTLNSGDQVGTYFLASPINHLHIGLTVDGKFVEPIQQAKMCVQ